MVTVHGITGEVLDARDIDLVRRPRENPFNGVDTAHHPTFDEALAVWEAHPSQAEVPVAAKSRVQGIGTVFDPDPVTTLMDDTLEDHSPAASFQGAYVERILPEITLANGQYTLDGPYCRIRNLEPPNTPPSQTADGIWDFTRGDNAFNDAMTYFHIDQNQRYLQALGYVEQKAIQDLGLEVDTDGEFGADNSHYSPLDNILSYGHGCVDDSEDADVILHEYAHAIQYGIYANWYGGDTGAIGEGLSDYWAGSYSYRTPNGRLFHPEWMFSWDGHNACWDGRVMNALTAQYDPARTYTAHQSIGGGYQSDELWSTPLFQAMILLTDQGYPIEDADRIVVESQFGVSAGISMGELAEITVQTASQLYPSGPHAGIFRASFARHNLINAPESYTYVSAHLPPIDDSPVSWKCEVRLTNPSDQPAQVQVVAYGNDALGAMSEVFDVVGSSNLQLGPGESIVFTPPGALQRWLEISSSQPLAGSSVFYRTAVVQRGEERVEMPLFDQTHRGRSITFAHVPEDRDQFWSGFVVVNPHDQPLALNITLVGDQGSELSSLLRQSSVTLAPRQKWVQYLTGGIFDDSASAEKVAFVEMRAERDILGFELYGLQDHLGAAATAGIMALPETQPSWWAVRCALTDLDWVGLSVLNPSDRSAPVTLSVHDRSGSVLMNATYTHEARSKKLGLLDTQGFVYPYRGDSGPLITLPDAFDVASITITSGLPLRVFELSGDGDRTVLDGSAVRGGLSHAMFPFPRGRLQIINGDSADPIVVTAVDAAGNLLPEHSRTIDAAAWSLTELDVTEWDAGSIRIQGRNFAAFLVDRDPDSVALTILAPSQILGIPP